MKKYFYIFLLSTGMIACKTQDIPYPVAHPQMRYTDLQNAEMKYTQPYFLDIDGDGSTDFSFGTMLVGDPIMQRDRLQFIASSNIGTNLLNNDNDQSPVLNNGDKISVSHKGYEWFELSAIVLAEKITGMAEPMHWAGLWRNVNHRYLPVQLKKNGKLYNGWIEVSFDSISEKLVLHKTAISIEAGKDIKAGY